jgi:hypothetical protein
VSNVYSLAMAEMTTLVAAVYRKYSTSIKAGCEDVAPGVTSRFEVFHDDTFDHVSVSVFVAFLIKLCV